MMITGDYQAPRYTSPARSGSLPPMRSSPGPEMAEMDDAQLQREHAPPASSRVVPGTEAAPGERAQGQRRSRGDDGVTASTTPPALKAAHIGIALGGRHGCRPQVRRPSSCSTMTSRPSFTRSGWGGASSIELCARRWPTSSLQSTRQSECRSFPSWPSYLWSCSRRTLPSLERIIDPDILHRL